MSVCFLLAPVFLILAIYFIFKLNQKQVSTNLVDSFISKVSDHDIIKTLQDITSPENEEFIMSVQRSLSTLSTNKNIETIDDDTKDVKEALSRLKSKCIDVKDLKDGKEEGVQ